MPSAAGCSSETWTSRPARAATSWSAWWWALTAVRETWGATRSRARSSRVRSPTGHSGLGRTSVSGRSRLPAPAARTTPTSPSRVTRPRSHAGNRRPRRPRCGRHARRDRRRRPVPPPHPRRRPRRGGPAGALGHHRAARLRGRGLPGAPRVRRGGPRGPRPVRAPRPDGRGGVRAGRAQGHAVAPAPRLRDRHLHDRRGDGPPGLQRRRRPDHQRRHPVDDRRVRDPAHRDAARGAGDERRPVPRLPAVGEPARATRSGRRRATRTSAAPRSGCWPPPTAVRWSG